MKRLLFLLMLTGCASTSDNLSALFDRLEFGEDEVGCLRIQTTIDLNPNIIFNSNTQVMYRKQKGDMEC